MEKTLPMVDINPLNHRCVVFLASNTYNNISLLLVAVVSAFTAPWAIIFIAFVMVFRDYYLLKNMKSLRQIIENNNNNTLKANKGELD